MGFIFTKRALLCSWADVNLCSYKVRIDGTTHFIVLKSELQSLWSQINGYGTTLVTILLNDLLPNAFTEERTPFLSQTEFLFPFNFIN